MPATTPSWMYAMQRKHAEFQQIDEFLDAPLEIKQMSEDGSFQGYGAVFGNMDSDRDIIASGAFSKTLAKKKPSQVKMLYQHDHRQPIGIWENIQEDKKGLLVQGKLLIGQGVPKADEAYALIKARAVDGLSIGFSIPEGGASFDQEKRVRTISEIDLWEISPVTFPANPRAKISRVKAVVPFQDLPLSDRGRAWDGSAAEARVRRWAGGGADLTDMDWQRYRKAFLWFDSDNQENVTSYKLAIADVIGGELTAVPRGIFASAGVLLGARGGVDIPEDAKRRIISHLERYYAKMDMESPFKAIDMGDAMKNAVRAMLTACTNVREFEHTLRDVGFSNSEAKMIASLAFKPQREAVGSIAEAVKAAKKVLQQLNP
jgi:HK97 family phage prohead protease